MKLQAIITDYIARTLLSVNGDIITRIAGVTSRLGIGTANQVLRTNSGTTAVEWGNPNTIDDANGITLKCKKVNIGDWDMVNDASKLVDLGVDEDKVMNVSVFITPDTGVNSVPLERGVDGTDTTRQGYINVLSGDYVELIRLTGGHFDNAAYDDTPFNRGTVFIWYIP